MKLDINVASIKKFRKKNRNDKPSEKCGENRAKKSELIWKVGVISVLKDANNFVCKNAIAFAWTSIEFHIIMMKQYQQHIGGIAWHGSYTWHIHAHSV